MFNMLSIGKKAVVANEKNLETTAHNIANVNTKGYSRQRVITEAAMPLNDAIGNYGNGVDIVRIERMRDLHLDNEYRKLNSNTGYWGTMSSKLSELEKSFIETSEYGINTMINQFFDKWEALANNPYSDVHRLDVIHSANLMTDSFKDLYNSIEGKREELKFTLKDQANRINEISEELASLTTQISQNTATNKPANDLLDKFDLLIDELSGFGNVQVHRRDNGTTSIYLGSDELVRNNISNKLVYTERRNLETDEEEVFLALSNTNSKVNGLTTGSVKAIYDLRDTVLTDYLSQLDKLAVEISDKVNSIHTKGFNNSNPPQTGAFFFNENVSGVKNFNISNEISSNPSFIATSLTGQQGDNQIALAITRLRYDKVFDDKTITETFADFIYEVGQDIKIANHNAERTKMLSGQTDSFREAVKGVSINEETANLLKFQQAYQAAAKIMSIADDMMKLIIGLAR